MVMHWTKSFLAVVLVVSGYQVQCTKTMANPSDDELRSISSKIWDSDTVSLTEADLKYDINGSKLFTYVNEAKLVGTYHLLDKLFDNYIPNTGTAEVNESGESEEQEKFLDAVLETKPMQILHGFLLSKGLTSATDIKSFKKELSQYWFLPYSRTNGVQDSSGFEHVFVGELKKKEVTGFHNWLHAYRQEKTGQFDYEGIIRTCPNDALAFKFEWMDYDKPITSLFMGASPELEMALFTLCIVTRANTACPVVLGGYKQSITTFKMDNVGVKTVASAYVNC